VRHLVDQIEQCGCFAGLEERFGVEHICLARGVLLDRKDNRRSASLSNAQATAAVTMARLSPF
jgi:hypothetical protein